ncbi:glycoside hydrolase family 127 protein [uncultured Pseudokineococcus sp.]|uniref:glycoside hydrolase family 127 protein n=1 Tax=uncultured Pseudokineococcus sp. TaxID=1642928 RepID=UPI00261E6557|nr:beta-L-arabinofuranosidase domain-containing protein [uncultured Pseudokineococcus sp.]
MSTTAAQTPGTTAPAGATTAGPAAPTPGSTRLAPVAPGAARLEGGWWAARQRANRERAIPEGRQHLEEWGNLDNLRIAAGTREGVVRGPVFMDSDVYKWLEAAAWEHGREPSAQLLQDIREVTAVVAAAQAEDGYLDSVVQERGSAVEPGPDGDAGSRERYSHLPWSHEHYCAGHLMQAAVAVSRATGERGLLDVAVRLADHLVETFGDGPGQIRDVDGHPVVEMGLAELFRETGDRRYLDLAGWFVEARGQGLVAAHGHGPTYFSDRVRVREATTVEGHAVRAVYLAAGAADVAAETGDAELLEALRTQFAHMLATKTYLTGGLGSRWDGEAFGDPYELPSDRAYAETCAAIGGVQWAWRMLLATGDALYADALERMLYNGFAAGVSLSGDQYFYVNALQVRGGAHPDHERSVAAGRQTWFGCACCPPNVMRTLSSLDAYLATTDDEGLQLHQYAPGRVEADVPGGRLSLVVETAYPWHGSVVVRVEQAPESPVALSLRVPGWAEGAVLRRGASDEATEESVPAGAYAVARGTFTPGDVVELVLPVAPRLTRPHARVDDARGCLALERGPLVYAVEEHDLPEGVALDDVVLDPTGALEDAGTDEALDGAVRVRARGRVRGPESGASTWLPADAPAPGRDDELELVAVPYATWANRGPGPVRVWVPTA